MMKRVMSANNRGRRPAGTALVRLALLGALLVAAPAFSPASLAGQEPGTWEFNFSYVVPSMDGSPLVLDTHASGDFGGDGTIAPGLLTQTFDLANSSFPAFRLGYIWNFYLETEVTYDTNHFTSDYNLTVENLNTGREVENVSGPVSSNLTTYEFSVQYYPIGNRRWKWQPYVYLGAGWYDIDFTPSSEIEAAANSSLVTNTFSVDFPPGDHGVMLDYGIGVKFFVLDELALRAEWRSKQYDLLGDRRLDRELSFGISFITAGER